MQESTRCQGFPAPGDGPIPIDRRDERSLAQLALLDLELMEQTGHSSRLKAGPYYGKTRYQQLMDSGISNRAWTRALGRIADIARGDLRAISLRRHQLMTLTLSQVDEIVMQNYLNGTQHVRVVNRSPF